MNKKLIRIATVPRSFRTLLKGQLKYMNTFYKVMAITSKGEALETVKENEQVPFKTIPLNRSISPFKDIQAIWQLYKILKKEKPFIVHTHTPKAGLVGMIASKLAKTPNRLHTVAGMPILEETGVKRKILEVVEWLTYLCATKVYPNSNGLKEIIIQNNYTKISKLKVIGKGSSNGIDTTHFNPDIYSKSDKEALQKSLNIDKNDIVYVFVGRMVKDKGLNELIAAYKVLHKTHKNVKLLLVGSLTSVDNAQDPLFEETTTEILENKSIISVGYQKDVRPYFNLGHILTFPSYREGFPNVVLQAGAMGLPSIVSNINGCNEIIEDNYNGIIVPVKDEKALLQQMDYLYLNPEVRNKLAKNARPQICKNYEQSYIWSELLKEYQSLEIQ